MTNKEKARKEIEILLKELNEKEKVISEKYKSYVGLDGPATVEIRNFRKKFLEDRREILIRYGLPIPN